MGGYNFVYITRIHITHMHPHESLYHFNEPFKNEYAINVLGLINTAILHYNSNK